MQVTSLFVLEGTISLGISLKPESSLVVSGASCIWGCISLWYRVCVCVCVCVCLCMNVCSLTRPTDALTPLKIAALSCSINSRSRTSGSSGWHVFVLGMSEVQFLAWRRTTVIEVFHHSLQAFSRASNTIGHDRFILLFS